MSSLWAGHCQTLMMGLWLSAQHVDEERGKFCCLRALSVCVCVCPESCGLHH